MNNGSQVSLNVLLWHFAITRNMRTLNNGPRQKVLTLQYVTTFAVTSCFLREGNKGCQMFQWLAIHLWHMCRGTLVPLHHFCMDVLFFRCVRAQWRCCCYWRARSGAPERGTHTHTHRCSSPARYIAMQWGNERQDPSQPGFRASIHSSV